ncbi:MAG TPA: hypothetical protein VJN88_13265 [Ktedonobacterales bacterium]|nr:hypothetical protein [Ktedonobacterales bacterium]
MGPTIARRAHGAQTLGWREYRKPLNTFSSGRLRQVTHQAVLILVLYVALLTSPQVRHWVVEATANLLVLGGFIAAPILTVIAWVGLMLPAHLPLHRLSSTLFVVALVWVAGGLLIAHVLQDPTTQTQK